MFKCTCSEKRCENAVRLLGKDEAESILLEKQRIVVTCEFCNANFQFDRVDVERLFKSDLEPPESNKPH
jgi:molecular chaperone Hsp33